jgi:hypothetical protein
MHRLHEAGELVDDEFIDLKGLITNGNKNEEKLNQMINKM